MVKMSNFLIIPRLENIEESLALAEKYGFGFEYNDFFTPDVLEDNSRTEELAVRYKSCGIPERCTMHGAFLDVLVFSEDALIREVSRKRIVQSIEAAERLGAEAVIFHTNYEPLLTAESYRKNWLDRNESFWREILAEYPNISVYMENMFDGSPHMLAELAERLSGLGNFGVCLDYAHAASFGRGTPLKEWVQSLAPYVKHLHINDNDLKNDLHLAVGNGRIDWSEFKKYYLEYFLDCTACTACTVLIETSHIEDQKRSAEFLKSIGIL